MSACCNQDCAQGRHCPLRLTERHLDARQRERETAPMSLPDLLLSKGSMTGPHKFTHPVTRWSRALRRFARALGRFLAARRIEP